MGIWFKKMPADYYNQLSFFEEDVMLWQNDMVYVMDNHRDAAWCWLQQCEDGESYNFMHIDRHYDMGDYYYDEDLEPVRNNPRMDYLEYANLIRKDGGCKTLRWDNYIRFTHDLRPNWFKTNVFLTQKDGDICVGWHENTMRLIELDALALYGYMHQYLLELSDHLEGVSPEDINWKWIVNIDLDMFFYHYDDNIHLKLYSDGYIREVAKLLQKAMDKIQVLTIAISPDCLIGDGMKEKWYNGFRVLRIMAEEIVALQGFLFPENID